MGFQRFTIDRFENDLALLEVAAGVALELPRAWLPADAKEGDVLQVNTRRNSKTGAVLVRFLIDPEATTKRREEALKLRENLARGPEGDLEL